MNMTDKEYIEWLKGVQWHDIEQKVLSDKIILDLTKFYIEACQNLCGVLYQSYNGYFENVGGKMKTRYNYDAQAVWFLKDHGYVEIIKGEWPKTKYITFKFTDRFKK